MYGSNLSVRPVRANPNLYAWARLALVRGGHPFDWEAWTIDAPDLIPCGSLVHTGDDHMIGFPSAQQRVVSRERNRTIWVAVDLGCDIERIEVEENTTEEAIRRLCGE